MYKCELISSMYNSGNGFESWGIRIVREQKVRLPWSMLTRVISAFVKSNFLQKVRLPAGRKIRAPRPPTLQCCC